MTAQTSPLGIYDTGNVRVLHGKSGHVGSMVTRQTGAAQGFHAQLPGATRSPPRMFISHGRKHVHVGP